MPPPGGGIEAQRSVTSLRSRVRSIVWKLTAGGATSVAGIACMNSAMCAVGKCVCSAASLSYSSTNTNSLSFSVSW